MQAIVQLPVKLGRRLSRESQFHEQTLRTLCSTCPVLTNDMFWQITAYHTCTVWSLGQRHSILIDRQSTFLLVFSLVRESLSTWAAIAQNTEIKVYRQTNLIGILTRLKLEERGGGACFVPWWKLKMACCSKDVQLLKASVNYTCSSKARFLYMMARHARALC